MSTPEPSPIAGFVLAGGQSSRMGRDKALLALAGKPLLQHALTKLRRLCAEVAILGNRAELASFGSVIHDAHTFCGPLGGMEAALRETRFEWNLFVPVDVPFLPTAFLDTWVRLTLPSHAARGARVLTFRVDGRPQPTLALVHRAVRPFLTEALERQQYKLLPALERAATALAIEAGYPAEPALVLLPYSGSAGMTVDLANDPGEAQAAWGVLTPAQQREEARWFSNLNTPEEFAEAERHVDALDT